MPSTPYDRALDAVGARAARAEERARATIARLAPYASAADLARELVEGLAARARLTLSFHPDRLGPDGRTVAEGLLHDGRYRSQFDTGVTNGSPTAFPGGDRDRWEERLFEGAYHGADVVHFERPKYGAFNVMGHPDGGSPRFGSCFFELGASVLPRCTFTWGDSHEGPEHVGTMDRFEDVLAACLEAVATTGSALGVGGLDVERLVARLSDAEQLRPRTSPGRALDDYVEAQVHGPVELARDVEALVVDPAFLGTETGAHLRAIAARHGIALRRHAGFVLHPSEVPDDFRGPRMPALAARIAGAEELDAVKLGRAARSLARDPSTWLDWGPAQVTWQHLKQLWHVLVRYGHARGAGPEEPPAS